MTETTSTPDGQIAAHRPKRGRSPSYPGIDLKEAIEKAKTLYDAELRHKAPIDVILGHWGYATKSGAGMVALAALKKFGLVEDEGGGSARKAGLSQTGLAIVLDDDPDSNERTHLIRQAALKPPIHKELWKQYGGQLPSEATLRTHLVRDRAFSKRGADELIQEFKSTIAFAKLSGSDSVQDTDQDEIPEANDIRLKDDPMMRNAAGEPGKTPPDSRPPPSVGTKTYRLPLMRDEAILQLPSRMTDASWRQMIAVLEAMKPGIIDQDDATKS